MNDFRLSKEEYIEFLSYKRDKLLQQVRDIDEQLEDVNNNEQHEITPKAKSRLSKLNGNGQVSLNGKDFAGWKYYVDEVLIHAEHPLTANEIVSRVVKNPDLATRKNTATKSVGSALSMHSPPKKDRYLWTKNQRGIKLYSFNKEFKE